MANTHFQFKQFNIRQDQCAMKVCTDACIFGAYAARLINDRQLVVNTVLDIGTGTGLLSLMIAQVTAANIDAVEIDVPAFQQAADNFKQSPWSRQLNIFNQDALEFTPGKKYDCIISNPPFYSGDLRSANQRKNSAKHDETLTLEQLLTTINKHLEPTGFFTILLPYHRTGHFIECASSHFALQEQVSVQHTISHPFSRSILIFSRHQAIVKHRQFAIRDLRGSYTPEFTELLQPYYLYL